MVAAALVMLARQGSSLRLQSIHLNLLLVILAALLACASQLACALIWHRILGAFGVHRSLQEDIRIYYYSALGAAIPGSIWGLVSRSVLYSRMGVSAVRVAAATVLEALVIGVAGMAVYAVTVVVRPSISIWRLPILGYGAGVVALVLINPRVLNRLHRWVLKKTGQPAEADFPTIQVGQLALWLTLEALIVAVGGLTLFMLLNGFAPAPRSALLPMVVGWSAAVATGNLFLFIPGTFVLRDGALVLALAPTLTLAPALLFAALSRVWSIAALLLGAAIVAVVIDLPVWLRRETRARATAGSARR